MMLFCTVQIIKAALFVTVLAALLFGVSGDIFWIDGWVYLGVFSGCSIINMIIMARHNPELLKEAHAARSWRKVVGPGIGSAHGRLVCPALIVAAAALQVRLEGASPFPVVIMAASVACAAAGYALMTWAMMSNDFFSALIRIQTDRGHRVTTQDPYRFVRHPGYVGMLMFAVSTPFMLGSSWALVPAAANLCVGILRTALEDRTLLRELEGYVDYAGAVPYRLLPGIW